MGTSNGAAIAEVERLRNTAWAAIGSATMDGPIKDRYWSAWTTHCRLYPDNDQGPHLPPSNIGDMLLTFAVAVREGKYGLGHQVKVQSVAVALRSVAQKYVLDGHPDPRRALPAQHALDLPIARILKCFDDKDPEIFGWEGSPTTFGSLIHFVFSSRKKGHPLCLCLLLKPVGFRVIK
jgi:hypothetical protein